MPLKFENPADDVDDAPPPAAPPPPAPAPIIVEAPKLRPPVVNVEVNPTPVKNEITVMPAEVVVQVVKEAVQAAPWQELRFHPVYYADGRIEDIIVKRIK